MDAEPTPGRAFALGAVSGVLAFVASFIAGRVGLLDVGPLVGPYSSARVVLFVAVGALALYATGPPTPANCVAVAVGLAATDGPLGLLVFASRLLEHGLGLSYVLDVNALRTSFQLPFVAGLVGTAVAYAAVSTGLVSPRAPVGPSGEPIGASGSDAGLDRNGGDAVGASSGRRLSDAEIEEELGLTGTVRVTNELDRPVACRVACRVASNEVLLREDVTVRPDADFTWTGVPPATEVEVGVRVDGGPSATRTFEGTGATAADPTITIASTGIDIVPDGATTP